MRTKSCHVAHYYMASLLLACVKELEGAFERRRGRPRLAARSACKPLGPTSQLVPTCFLGGLGCIRGPLFGPCSRALHPQVVLLNTLQNADDGQPRNDQEFCTKMQRELKKAIFGMCTVNPTNARKPSHLDTKAYLIFKRVLCNYLQVISTNVGCGAAWFSFFITPGCVLSAAPMLAMVLSRLFS